MKRVTAFKNGKVGDGKVLFVEGSFEDFLRELSQKFEMPVKRIFIKGGEAKNIREIWDNDVLFLSAGEDYIEPSEDYECDDSELETESEISSTNLLTASDFKNIMKEISHEFELYRRARGNSLGWETFLKARCLYESYNEVKSEDMWANRLISAFQSIMPSTNSSEAIDLSNKLKKRLLKNNLEDLLRRKREDSIGGETASKTTDEPDREKILLNLINSARNRITEMREVAVAPMPKEDLDDFGQLSSALQSEIPSTNSSEEFDLLQSEMFKFYLDDIERMLRREREDSVGGKTAASKTKDELDREKFLRNLINSNINRITEKMEIAIANLQLTKEDSNDYSSLSPS